MINKLDKSICVFDIESTGLSVAKDRIVSLAITKLLPDGTKESKYAIFNPGIPIPKEASDVHGITDEMVFDKPKFSQLAKGIRSFIGDSYIAGYNNNFFDNEMLLEEFYRCGIEFPNKETVSIDACSIFKHFEKRDLTSALKFYCNENLTDAHNAQNDVDATVKVLFAQLERYEELKDKTLTEISKMFIPENYAERTGKILIDQDGDYVWSYGKHKGEKLKKTLSYNLWMYGTDISTSIKIILKKVIDGE